MGIRGYHSVQMSVPLSVMTENGKGEPSMEARAVVKYVTQIGRGKAKIELQRDPSLRLVESKGPQSKPYSTWHCDRRVPGLGRGKQLTST